MVKPLLNRRGPLRRHTLDAMPSGSAVGVLLASDIVQGVIDEPTYDLNQAHEEIDIAKVSHHATDLFPAVVARGGDS